MMYKECPEYIIALLRYIDEKLRIIMWNKYQEEYSSPFSNTGNKYRNDVFEVEAYSWNDEIEQKYNFKYKDIEISWYKYLGRDTRINREVNFEEIEKMFDDCVKSLDNML